MGLGGKEIQAMRRVIIAIVSVSVITTMIAMGSRSYPDQTEGIKNAPGATKPSDGLVRPMTSGQIATSGAQPSKAYTDGYALGECLAADKCQLFEATIQAIGEPRKQAGQAAERSPVFREVLVTVDQNLGGPGNVPGQRVSLESVGSPAFTKTALGPWNVWENVQLAVGGKVIIALWGPKAQRGSWEGKLEKVALVTSDLDSFRTIREIVNRHQEVEARPEELLEISRRTDQNDHYLLGYLMAYANKKLVVKDVDLAAKVFSSLLTNEAVPEFVRNDIPARLLVDSYRFSYKARNTATKSLVVAAANDNAHLSEIAIDVLIQLSDDKRFDMKPFLTPDVRPKLLANYESLLARRGGSRKEHRSFENQIGINVPN
jgi:hypothetical protein